MPSDNRLIRWGLIALFSLPFALLILLTLGREWRFPDALPQAYSVDALTRLLSADNELLLGLGLSLLIATTTAILATGLGFLMAREIVRSPLAGRWMALSYLPYALPPVLLAILLQPVILRLHLFGTVLGVGLGLLLITLPFATLFFRSFWSQQALQYEQLSRSLGCTPTQVLTQVIIPLARPLLITCLFQTFLISWFDFGLTSFLSVGKVRTLTVQVFMYVGEANSRFAAFASLMLILPPALLLWINKVVLLKKM